MRFCVALSGQNALLPKNLGRCPKLTCCGPLGRIAVFQWAFKSAWACGFATLPDFRAHRISLGAGFARNPIRLTVEKSSLHYKISIVCRPEPFFVRSDHAEDRSRNTGDKYGSYTSRGAD